MPRSKDRYSYVVVDSVACLQYAVDTLRRPFFYRRGQYGFQILMEAAGTADWPV